VCRQCCSKLVSTKCWVVEIVRQRVSGHRADNSECLTTKLAVTMSWNDELVATDRVKTLTAGDIRSRCAAVHEVLGRPALKTLVDGHSTLYILSFCHITVPWLLQRVGWLCSTVVECRSLAAELSLSCARSAADG